MLMNYINVVKMSQTNRYQKDDFTTNFGSN